MGFAKAEKIISEVKKNEFKQEYRLKPEFFKKDLSGKRYTEIKHYWWHQVSHIVSRLFPQISPESIYSLIESIEETILDYVYTSKESMFAIISDFSLIRVTPHLFRKTPRTLIRDAGVYSEEYQQFLFLLKIRRRIIFGLNLEYENIEKYIQKYGDVIYNQGEWSYPPTGDSDDKPF